MKTKKHDQLRAERMRWFNAYAGVVGIQRERIERMVAEIGEHLGVSAAHVHNVRRGDQNFGIEVVEKIRKELGAKTEFLDPSILLGERALKDKAEVKVEAPAKKTRRRRKTKHTAKVNRPDASAATPSPQSAQLTLPVLAAAVNKSPDGSGVVIVIIPAGEPVTVISKGKTVYERS